MHKAGGGREAAAIRIVPVGRVELSMDIRSGKETGGEAERERECGMRGGAGERVGIARWSITCGSN